MAYKKDSIEALRELIGAHEHAIRWLTLDGNKADADGLRDCLNAMMETMELEKCTHCEMIVESDEMDRDLCALCNRAADERAEDQAADLRDINTRGR